MKSVSSAIISASALVVVCICNYTLAWTTASNLMPKSTVTTKLNSGSRSRLFAKLDDLVPFAKYEGLGNDFILIDARDSSDPTLSPDQCVKLCNRNFGVGGDGVIFALAPPEGGYDFRMRIYNSDGSEPEMCGNGIRCLAAFLADLGEGLESYKIDTLAGPIVPVMNEDGSVTVDMGEPILEAALVPTTLAANDPDGVGVIDQTLVSTTGKTWKVSAVSMGNPHAIIFVDDLETDIDFETDGPALESDPAFPARINVEFVQVLSDTHLRMKVWERGAGPTLACGTGTCALVVAAIRAGKIPRPPVGDSVRVTLPGGDLFIEWRESNNRVYMTGPADLSFRGEALLK